MGIVIGIDVGGSTTKIVGMQNGLMVSPLMVKASDPKASIFGAFGRFLDDNSFSLGDVERIMVTGVGAAAIEENIYGISTVHVDEFRAIGRGGLFLSGLEHAIIVSMGTATALVAAKGGEAEHICGTGIGGGTLLMVWMTGVAALPQQTAQGINLLYFLPSAACALLFHIRNRLIRWDIVLPAALGGCVTAAIAAWIATGLDVSLLRRLFGGFLLLTGLRELFFRQQRDKNAR